ncbi:MAG: hypothetical protein JO099_01320 [Acidobacteriia bacterium]|nr:hypothetical protein [Terriglobia bacterium]
MRAIILFPSPAGVNTSGLWGPTAPLVDRPFIQHIVEFILDQNVRDIDFVLGAEYEAVRRLFGTGIRWGGHFRYHFLSEPAGVYEALGRIPGGSRNERILLASADRLAAVDVAAASAKSHSTLFCWREAGESRWTGWAVLKAADIRRTPADADERDVYCYLLSSGDAHVMEVPPPLKVTSHADLIESNRRMLAREHPGLLVGGREMKPGVWLARNASVHPSARVVPPVYVGENSKVGPLAQVGPGAAIGKNCIVKRETIISDSVIYPGSYVGERLQLNGVLVDRSRLVNVRLGAEIEGVDELLLGSVLGGAWRPLVAALFESFLALVLFVLASPVLAAVFCASVLGILPPLKRTKVVRTPAVSDPHRWRFFDVYSFGPANRPRGPFWRYFLLCFLPALPQIVLGRMAFCGPEALDSDQLRQRLDGWEGAVFRTRRPGAFQEDVGLQSVSAKVSAE